MATCTQMGGGWGGRERRRPEQELSSLFSFGLPDQVCRKPLEAETEGFAGKARKIKCDPCWLVNIPSWVYVCRGFMKPSTYPLGDVHGQWLGWGWRWGHILQW